MVRGGTTYRIVSDWRGDVRLVIDTTKTGAAAVVQQIDYDEWGNVTNLVDPACTLGGTELCFQPFGFAGGVWVVTTGLVRFGVRDYDPQARRWTQKDPWRFRGHQGDLYVYVNDDPVNLGDPHGTATYICTIPLNSLGFIPPGTPLFHQYVCVVQGGIPICGSFNPSGSMFGSPGQNDPNDQFNPSVCQQVNPDDPCVEDCIATISENPASYPFYNVGPGGYQCQDWTKDVVNYCNTACSQ
jgi:RHS repeat-associated protein